MTSCNTYMRFYPLYKIRAHVRRLALYAFPRPMCMCGHSAKDHVQDDPLNWQNVCKKCICQGFLEPRLTGMGWKYRPRWRA